MDDLVTIARSLPKQPGVYLFHSQDETVLYVGKAINLRNRVGSYFLKSNALPPPKLLMLEEITRIEHILVQSETEALLLESTLIKKYRPKYNVLLKDDKFFQYIKIGLGELFPQVETVRRITLDGSRYFGPYTSGLSVRRTLKLLKRSFPFKTCRNKPSIPCFDYQLGRCSGHDTGPGSEERYREIIKKLMHFLEGDTGGLLKQMKNDMRTAAKQHRFETAALLRDRIEAIEHILEQQTVITVRRESFDVVSLARVDELAAVNLFQIRQGKLVQRDQFMMQHVREREDAEILYAFVEQYYSQSTNHPRDVYVPIPIANGFSSVLQLHVHPAQRGLKRKLVKMGAENAEDYLRREKNQWLSAEAKARLALSELAHGLKLPGPPHRIEMYDVSHHQSQHVVASMVVFENGQPKKSDYRKFSIRDLKIPDDQHRLAEVLRRRFARHDDTAWPWPDLIILDGGKSQLSVVMKNVPGLSQHVPLAALAKEREEIFLPELSKPVRFPEGSEELFLVQRIRDEAHRFAIGFYRQKHRQASTRSILDEIPGLGPVAKKELLKTFGTVQGIREASDDAVAKVIGESKISVLRQYI